MDKIFKEKKIKKDKNRYKIVVLGAGASIGAKRIHLENSNYWLKEWGMPGTRNFFYDLSKVPYKKPGTKFAKHRSLLPFLYERSHLFIEELYQIKNWKEWKNVNLEDLLTFVDIGTKLYTKNSSYSKMCQCVQKDILQYINLEISSKSHNQKCEHLTQLFQSLTKRDTILSFNWDTLADTSLNYLNHPIFKSYLEVVKNSDFKVRDFDNDNKGVFLKLHGSVNWKFCSNKKCDKKNQLCFIENIHPIGEANCSCGSQLNTLIIPPVSNKEIIHKNSFFKKMWKIAANKVVGAEEIIFIGYSFPATDYYSEWLFRQTVFSQYENFKITVINPSVVGNNSKLRKRYKDLFKGSEINFYEDLSEYLSKNQKTNG